MTLFLVIMLDAGIIMVVSAFENKPLKQTFSDVLHGAITPATPTGQQTTPKPSDTTGVQSGTPVQSITPSAPIVRRTQ